jgi:hypothetical protein
MGDHFRFGSVFIKKITKPKPGQTDRFRFGSVWFGFLGQKPVQTGSARFFRFGSVLARFFFRFFVGFGSVRFFRFFGYKTETEPAGFFKNLIGLIGFFFGSVFLVFFFRFSRFNQFSGFFAHPYFRCSVLPS